jgi:hypothetical protein
VPDAAAHENRGKQTVVVQHLTVSQFGQAVVAGRLNGGRRCRGKAQE